MKITLSKKDIELINSALSYKVSKLTQEGAKPNDVRLYRLTIARLSERVKQANLAKKRK